MLYYFDNYGWLSNEPILGRLTQIAPPTDALPEGIAYNFTGYGWSPMLFTQGPDLVPVGNAVVSEVSMRKAQLALSRAGLLDTVTAIIDSLPDQERIEARIEWEKATSVKRSNPLVQALKLVIPLSEEDLDNLFTAAGAISD